MKKLIILAALLFMSSLLVNAQTAIEAKSSLQKSQIKLGMVIYSNDAETIWNALRLANFSLNEGDSVSIFLLGKGVELQSISSKEFDVQDQLNTFSENGGKVLACGTCLRSRGKEGSAVCPLSSMSELYQIIKKSDKVLTF